MTTEQIRNDQRSQYCSCACAVVILRMVILGLTLPGPRVIILLPGEDLRPV